MLDRDIHSVNHVGMAVRDMARTAARYEALGFLLTPYSVHSGAWKPGEAVSRLGYGNRCAVFGHNYIEILASENAGAPSPRIEGFLARHEGAHIICFGTDAPHSVDARLKAAGVATSGVIPLQREVDTPEGPRTARFERLQFSPEASPEGYIQAARHLTPQYIHQPRYIRHPNHATALSEVFLVVDDPELFEAKYARYAGGDARREGAKRTFRFPLASKLSIVDRADCAKVLPGSPLAPLPCIAGIAVQTTDLAGMRARLRAADIPYDNSADAIVVPADEAMGIAIVFEPV